jgi:kinesin family protein C1
MQGSGNGSMRGLIPRAMQQVGQYKNELESKGWAYEMEVSFIEIYNETIRDLLRNNSTDDLKHEIKKDAHGKINNYQYYCYCYYYYYYYYYHLKVLCM